MDLLLQMYAMRVGSSEQGMKDGDGDVWMDS